MGASKNCFADPRVIGAIALAGLTVVAFFCSEPPQRALEPRVARGEPQVQITSLALSPTGTLMATTNTVGQIALRDAKKEWLIERFLDFPGYATAVAFSPDGRFLAAVGREPSLCIWDLALSKSAPTTSVVLPIKRARYMMFSPDGNSLAVTNTVDGTILLWDLAARRERLVLRRPSPIAGVAFSPDGKRLAAAGRDDRQIFLWDLESGFRQQLSDDLSDRISALAFSPDGSLLASASPFEHHVCLWDLKTRRVNRVFVGHVRSVTAVAFSPDGSLLATGGNDGTLGLWKVATGHRLASLDAQALALRNVTFSPDGRLLALTTWNDDDVRLWNVDEILKHSLAHISINRNDRLETNV
jgi:WD40 repeat protein